MNYIETIEIEGFWGDKQVIINFNRDINFIVGVNGSGKTTIINLIVAAIKLDFPTLDTTEFDRILIKFRSFDKSKFKPNIEIKKTHEEYSVFNNINVKIRFSTKEEPIDFSLNELEEERFLRGRRVQNRVFQEGLISKRDSIYTVLRNITSVNWLSINRFNNKTNGESHEPSVDRKIDEITNKFIRHFSLLQSEVNEETELFQKQIFLSLISDESEGYFRSNDSLNIPLEIKSLRDIFREFDVPERHYSKKIEKHYENYERANQRVKNSENLNFNHAASLIGTNRIHKIVQQWTFLEQRKKEIFRSRDLFLEIVNSMLQRKKLIFTKNNDFIVKTQSNKEFSLKKLSSGEKQLIIILGEALLQNDSPHIYIADEPELSLHVDWQEKLVKSIKTINSTSQVIFATHSPDIVGDYQNSVIFIEDCIL
ncbi:AAA family ATPase [Sphingobacterium sp. NGMCC 1.201703]|uniref:AAA family ATPase n=1 Tax=Sphingobacterium sp. NGMCC 1.201703 TaxID=3388657 RepID=UPI0039FC55C6